MPLTDEENLAYDLLRSLGTTDLIDPVKSLPKVLAVFERVKAPVQAQLDKALEQQRVQNRADAIRSLVQWQHVSHEDASRFVDEKLPFDMEYGPCRTCDGMGSIFEPGCMGSTIHTCPTCNHRKPGNRLRLRLPWAPNGPAIPFDEARKLNDF